VRLHYNPDCVHGDLPTTQLRIMYAAKQYAEALQEIARLNALPLEPSQRLVVNVHEVMARLVIRRVKYKRARARLAELAALVQKLNDENFVAELHARRIGVAARYSDHNLATHLTNCFFDDITRTDITEAHWRMAQGASAQHVRGPAAAIPFYLTVLFNLDPTDRPCLHEMAVRRLAFCVNASGDKRGAVAALREWGLPASIEPVKGEIALADLLTLPLM
jgi:antitoxin component of MazEF toxin-antitoxin module